MRYKKFGNTGLFVSELCLGTMTFGGQGELWSKIGQLPQEEANRLVGAPWRPASTSSTRRTCIRKAVRKPSPARPCAT